MTYKDTAYLKTKESLFLDPEIKRKIIGDTFVTIAENVKMKLNLDKENVLLCQGTLRPDLIESASQLATKGR